MEAVLAVGEPGVLARRAAVGERAVVERTLERRAGLVGAERERGARAVGQRVGACVDPGLRGDRVDRPGMGGRGGVGVAGAVGGADAERVLAVGEAAVLGLARAELGLVERALEPRARFGGGEREGGAGAVGQ